MDELHDSLDKLFTEVDHLDRLTDADELPADRIELALSIAKKVRREATDVIRNLARRRDGE
jgi:hypothetical protein